MQAKSMGRGEAFSDFASRDGGRGGGRGGRGGGRGGGGGGDMDVRGMPKRPRDGAGGGQHATDDKVVDRFIKRQRTRGR